MAVQEEDDIEEYDDGDEPGASGEAELAERERFIVNKGQESLRIDKFLQNRLEGATRNKLQQALDEGLILVNGKTVKSNHKIKPGEEIVIFETRPSALYEIVPEDLPLDITYEDEDILIINKKVGMVVHPGCGNPRGTLVNGLSYYLKKEETEELPRIGLVHRIDKDTSGLLVIAKNEAAMQKMGLQFKNHTVHRRYIALVWGNLEEDEGTVVAHIGRHQRFRKIMAAYPDGELGKEAITHYKVLERFNYVTLIELRLETGRTHQIRVHMKHIGHPLFSDSTYGGDYIVKGTVFTKYKQFVENCFKLLPRHALHAKELGFIHPDKGQPVLFDSELPEDMVSVIEKWRTYIGGMTRQLKEQMDNG
ncbi:MAG: RluA family pseudouridine synthase [Phycisphaerales bacterium]|nr:RluA family pseudouridine synthase [Phycisphaerales bacterium]